MKKIISLILILLVSAGIYSQSQIPNGNFENWSDEYHAVGWNSINYGFPLNIHSAVRTTDSYQGSFAANLTTESTALGIVPGLITLGEIDIENLTITGGIPFTDVPAGLSCYFKYSPVAGDTMYFAALLTKWNDVNQETDTIGFTAFFTDQAYNNYTYVAVPFEYISWGIPDTLNVVLISSGFSGNAGSSLTADEITLEYGTVISPTICFPAADTTSSQFTANWLDIPNATSYSLDVSEVSNFSSFVSGYENLDTGTDTFYTVDISPGIYYYRVRVHYDTEVSINSNTIPVPAPTECTDATDITTNSFTANWQPANNATSYFIDVSTDENFETYVAPYENYSAGINTNTLISDLENNTEYFYRVRVEYDSFLSKNSNTVSVNTDASGIEDVFFNNTSVFSTGNCIIIQSDKKNLLDNIFIYDINGKLIKQITEPSEEEIITISKSGVYIVKLNQKNNYSVKKISVVF
ncbi:MAG: PCMD domain-containing protein [Bacteroidales bacterium]|nr:PCMD domain-containing protein [Bacteroidales bacterium]